MTASRGPKIVDKHGDYDNQDDDKNDTGLGGRGTTYSKMPSSVHDVFRSEDLPLNGT